MKRTKRGVISIILLFCLMACGCGTGEDNSSIGEQAGAGTDASGSSSEAPAEPVTYLAGFSHYQQNELAERYEFDSDGNLIRVITYGPVSGNADGDVSRQDIIYWTEYQYGANGNLIKKTSYSTCEYVYEYDENGMPVMGEDGTQVYSIIYHADGILSAWTEYDADGNGTKQVYCDRTGNVEEQYEYEYDANGNNTKESYYVSFEYDENGNRVHLEEAVLSYRYEREYDSNGKMTKTNYYTTYYEDENDTPEARHWKEILFLCYEYEYDTSGNQVMCAVYDGNGNLQQRTENQYDTNGNLTEEAVYYGDSPTWRATYEYDASGNLTERASYADGNIYNRTENEYDANGNLIKTITYDSAGAVSNWEEFSYDDAGNQTEAKGGSQTGEIIWWNQFGYDSQGNQVKWTVCDTDGSILSQEERDADGYLVRIIRDGVELLMEEKYDDAGSLISRSFSDDTGVVEGYEFEYITE